MSSQLVSMEILPSTKEKSKKKRKQVRFVLPDNVDESSALVSKAGKQQEVKPVRKLCTKKPILRKFHPYLGQRKVEQTTKKVVTDNSGNIFLNKTFNITEGGSPEPMSLAEEQTESAILDRNENCKVRTKNSKVTKRINAPIKKVKSTQVIRNRKKHTKCVRKKQKGVVSKKFWVKRKETSRYKQSRKRGHGDRGNSKLVLAKKRKISAASLKDKKRKNKLKTKKRRYNSVKANKGTKRKNTFSKSSVKVRQLKKKIKKAVDKVRKAKASKNKMMRLKKRVNKTNTKKLKLKQSATKKRKQNQKKSAQKSRMIVKGRVMKQVKKRRRKIKIIPIERQEEVIAPLRVALLKYLTIEQAYEMNFDCCRKCCWDDWEEIDMEDIKCDYED